MSTEIARQEFGAIQSQAASETSIMAAAARERAAIEARYVMAERHPRNWDDVRVRLLRECDQPQFAELARYARPVGGGTTARGWSIRAIEVMVRCARNIYIDTRVVYDDERQRIIRSTVLDLEANVEYSNEVAVPKTVERREPGDRVVLSERTNSRGEKAYTVSATEEEIRSSQARLRSISIRDASRLLPGDLLWEAEQRIKATIERANKADPQAARKRLVDGFAAIGVLPTDLVNYVGHTLEALQPAELAELRGLYADIRDGGTTFQAALKVKWEAPEDPAARNDKLIAQADARVNAAVVKPAPAEGDASSGPAPPTEAEMQSTLAVALEQERKAEQKPVAFPRRKS